MTAAAETVAVWSERVRAWRASGEGATGFAEGKGFAPSTLRYWASRLKRMPAAAPRVVQLVPRAGVGSADLVLEVGPARVRVARGFDQELLAEVVSALVGVGR